MSAQDVSLTLPLSQAIARVKQMLFKPFIPGKWFAIGFCAWLARWGQGGFSGGSGYHSAGRGGTANVQQWLDQAKDYVFQNRWWLVPVAAAALLFGLAFWLLLLFLSSRGQFM